MLLRSRRQYATPLLEKRNGELYLVAIRDGIVTYYPKSTKGIKLNPRPYWGGRREILEILLKKYVLTWLPNASDVDAICEVLD